MSKPATKGGKQPCNDGKSWPTRSESDRKLKSSSYSHLPTSSIRRKLSLDATAEENPSLKIRSLTVEDIRKQLQHSKIDSNDTTCTTTNNINTTNDESKLGEVESQRRRSNSSEVNNVTQQQIAASVLVCDDEKTTLLIAKRILEKNGYKRVVTVSSGREALEAMKSEDFDLVLSDVNMPGMSGRELIHEIRKISKSVPILMMSSSDEETTVKECLDLGADHYISKPLKVDELKIIWQAIFRKQREMGPIERLEEEKFRSIRQQAINDRLERKLSDAEADAKVAADQTIRLHLQKIDQLSYRLEQSRKDNKDDIALDLTIETLVDLLSEFHRMEFYRNSVETQLSDLESHVNLRTKKWLRERLGLTNSYDQSYTSENSSKSSPKSTSTSFHLDFWPMFDSGASGKQARDLVNDWDLNAFDYSEDQLLPMVEAMFDNLDLIDSLDLGRDQFHNFVMDLKRHYLPDLPYHNFYHAFDVAQTVYLTLVNTDALKFLRKVEILAVMIAALIHDVEHQGLSNTFQCATSSDLAVRYNDRSVMENHHCSVGFSIIRKPKNNFVTSLTHQDYKDFRFHVIQCVLATDLALHADINSKWKAAVASWDPSDTLSRGLCMQMILKCSDVSNPAKSFHQARQWAVRVQEEFFMQGDRERTRGLPVSAFMDRASPALAKMQIGFIEHLVSPLMTSLAAGLPKYQIVLDRLMDNKVNWQSVLEVEAGMSQNSESSQSGNEKTRENEKMQGKKEMKEPMGSTLKNMSIPFSRKEETVV